MAAFSARHACKRRSLGGRVRGAKTLGKTQCEMRARRTRRALKFKRPHVRSAQARVSTTSIGLPLRPRCAG
eukprot:7533804-Alexandrium_andersonii.AAC.1